MPVDPLAVELFPGTRVLATETLLRSSKSVDEVTAVIADAPKADSLTVRRRVEVLRALEDAESLNAKSVVAAMAAIGLFCFVGLAVREAALTIRRDRTKLAIFSALGLSRRKITLTITILEGVVVAVALVVARLLVDGVGFGRVIADILPPSFRLPLTAVLALAGVSYVVVLGVATWHQLRESNIPRLLAERTGQ
jgi:hypothetical protein